MTEREKALSGQLYSPKDPELRKLHLRARKLFGRYNKIDPSNDRKLDRLIKKIFGKTGERIHVQPPFYCDYGINISVGENFFANYGCIILDVNRVTIGKNCMLASWGFIRLLRSNWSEYAFGFFASSSSLRCSIYRCCWRGLWVVSL